MIDSAAFLEYCLDIAIVLLACAFFVSSIRVLIGPSIVDRVVALDMLVGIAIGFIAVFGMKAGFHLYIDIAIALGLVGFLATVAFARFILLNGTNKTEAKAATKAKAPKKKTKK